MTIRGVPDSIHRALVERARRNRRSLNQQVIADLAGEEFDMQGADSKHSRAEMMILGAEQVRRLLPRCLSADEIDDAIREGRD